MISPIFIVIPAYNEEKIVGEVVLKCRMQNAECRIIVVDDGSKDRTAAVARQAGAVVLHHPINRGLGAALSTGIAGALRIVNQESPHQNKFGTGQAGIRNQGIVVTLDGDGQHDPGEIPQVIEPILKGQADAVIGSRFMIHNSEFIIPRLRRLANLVGNLFTWLLFGIWVSDSQSGFRAFSGVAAERLRLRTSTMEVSSEIIREIARLKLRLTEVPITVRYTAYSLSKGQGFLRGLETLWKLIVLRFFR